MLSRHGTLSLSRTMIDDDEVVLIPFTKGFHVRTENEYHEIDPRKALWMLESFDRRRWMEVRTFAAEAHLGNFPLHLMDDQRVLELIRDRVRDGTLIAIQKGPTRPEGTSATMELRRLTSAIEKATQYRLGHRGRSYKLVADVDLARISARNDYVVLSRATADRLLDELAREAGTPADLRTLLAQARAKLTQDWHPPMQPEGLVMLRREARPVATATSAEPAITPSQMRALVQAKEDSEKTEELTIQLHDHAFQPCADVDCVVRCSDGTELQQKTNRAGWLTCRVPKHAGRLAIEYWPYGKDAPPVKRSIALAKDLNDEGSSRVHLSWLGLDGDACDAILQYQHHRHLALTGLWGDDMHASLGRTQDGSDHAVAKELG